LALDAKGGENAYERVRELGGAREGVYSFELGELERVVRSGFF